MYNKPFYIETPVGNNSFCYEKRKNKKLYVTNLIDLENLDDIKLGNEIVFEDFDFDGKLISAKGLKNFYKYKWKNKDIYLFDNHNHAFYFWFFERNKNTLGNKNILFHIDEHSDMRIPEKKISLKDTYINEKVFNYTNFLLNVGNYIVPALDNGFIKEVIQIRSKTSLDDYDYFKNYGEDIILNLDLDFFEPALDYIGNDLKKTVILDIALKAKVITVCSSPFFINQELAIKRFKEIFGSQNNAKIIF